MSLLSLRLLLLFLLQSLMNNASAFEALVVLAAALHESLLHLAVAVVPL
jgi:hypothetical protein